MERLALVGDGRQQGGIAGAGQGHRGAGERASLRRAGGQNQARSAKPSRRAYRASGQGQRQEGLHDLQIDREHRANRHEAGLRSDRQARPAHPVHAEVLRTFRAPIVTPRHRRFAGMDQIAVTVIGVLFAVSTLALLALGLAIIFGMMGVLNLAQGEFLMLGAYTVLVASSHGLSVWAGIALAPIVVGLIGVIVERSIIRFLYGRPLDTMLATWGLSLVLVGAVTLIMGPTTEGVATPLGSFAFGRYSVSVYRIVVIAISAGALLATHVTLRYTRAGLVARATMQAPHLVAASGIEPERVYMSTFGLGAALAGLAGSVMAPLTGVVPTLGLAFIAKIFITVIVGGPTVLVGTTSAASVLGLVESAVSYASTPIYGQVAMLTVAMVLLRLLPNGFSGFWRSGL